jgi:drug/metabolite transporter (DMT)-like permease
MTRPMNRQEIVLLLALSLLWGSSFFFYKVLDEGLPPLTIVLGRVGLAAIVMNLALAARGEALGRNAPWGQLAVLGVLNCVIPFSLFAWAETQVSSGMAAMLNATTPLFSVVLAHFLTRTEKLTWARGVGVLLGLAGVAVLVGPAALHGLAGNVWGDAACIGAALSYGLAGQYQRRLRGLPSFHVATGQLTAGACVLLPVAALVDHFWALPMPGPVIWASLAGIAVLCTALAYTLFFRLMATAGPTNAMLVTFLLPISALLLGWLALGEAVPLRAVGGMALIGAGLAAIDGRVLRVRKKELLF